MGAEAREVVRHLREDDRMAARDRPRSQDAGHPRRAQETEVRADAAPPREGAAAGPIHVAADVDESRDLYNLVKEQGRDGALGIVQGEAALAKIEHIEAEKAHEEEEASE